MIINIYYKIRVALQHLFKENKLPPKKNHKINSLPEKVANPFLGEQPCNTIETALKKPNPNNTSRNRSHPISFVFSDQRICNFHNFLLTKNSKLK